MSVMTYNHLILDLLVPICFTITLYMISIGIKRIRILNKILSYIGTCTFTIFFTHAAFFYVWPFENSWMEVASAVITGCILHSILNNYKVSKFLFIGK